MRKLIIKHLDRFMWLKRRSAEALLRSKQKKLAQAYWRRGDERLLEQILPTDEVAEALLLEMHRHILNGTALFSAFSCPFCVVLRCACSLCPYGAEKGHCSEQDSVWRTLTDALPIGCLPDRLTTLELWQQSGCFALAESLLPAKEAENV